MNVSSFRYKIVIQQVTRTKDEYGAENEVWSTYKTLRAGKKDVGGSKGVDNLEVFNSKVTEFTTHYREGITEEMRVVCGDLTYKIDDIKEIGFKSGLTLICKKINE